MTIVIRPARMEDVDEAQTVMNHKDNILWLGGFVMREQIAQRIRKQEETQAPTQLVADCDGRIVGASEVSPKSAMMGMGLVAVDPEFKRKKIGTALYVAHVYRACLEGRPILVDKIREGNETMRGLLHYLGFYPSSVRRNNSKNHVNLDYYEFDLRRPGALSMWLDKQTIMSEDIQWSIQVPQDAYEDDFLRLADGQKQAGAPVEELIKNRARISVLLGVNA